MESRVLIVDDDEGVREMMSMLLSRLDVTIDQAQDGKQALDLILVNSYDLILTDLMMPRMSGKDLLTEMGRRGISCPVIVISAVDDKQMVLECLRLGALNFITKPWNQKELIEYVKLYVNDAKLSQQRKKLGFG